MLRLRILIAGTFCVLVLAACQSSTQDGAAPTLTAEEADIAQLREAAQRATDNAEAWYQLANALFDDRQLEEAATAYRTATEIDPDHARAHTNLGLTLRRLGDVDGAIAAYNRARLIEPDDTTLLTNIYTLQELRGDREAAFETLAQLHNAVPDDLEIMLRYADALYERERYSPAAALYARLAIAAPSFDRAHFRHGMCLYKLNALDRALDVWNTALAVNPENVAILQALPVFYLERGDWHNAWASVRRCQIAGIAIDSAVIERLQNESGQVGPE